MGIVATGTLADRPLGRTFAAIAQRRFTGDLRLTAAGQRHAIGWRDGYVVAATGGHPADSAVKVALGGGLITSSQASTMLRSLSPDADDVAVVADLARLGAEHVVRLRRRVIANRAMRVFAYEAAEFVVDDALGLAVAADVVPIDPRVIVFQAVRAHYTDDRLRRELGAVGGSFRVRADAPGLDAFGFVDAERTVLDALAARASTPAALVDAVPSVEPRLALAVLYAVAMFGYCDITGAPVSLPSPPAAAAEAERRRPSTPRSQRISLENKGKVDATQIRALVTDRLGKMNGGADHFQLLGVTEETPPEKIRAAYFDIARQLHPDRITATGLDDIRADAQRLFAQINAAFGVLSHPKKRAEYLALQRAGGEEAVRRRQDAAEDAAARILAAEDQFRAGEMALRRNHYDAAIAAFTKAVELNPDESEHHALLAWASWCAAPDKAAAGKPARAALERASHMSPKNPVPHLYLGKIARSLGDDEAAARHFRRLLEVAPGHGEGTSELRVVEARLAQRAPRPTGRR